MGRADSLAIAEEFQQGEMMLVVLPICASDSAAMLRLLAWIERLGGCKGHNALVVADQGTPFNEVVEVRGTAANVFDAADLIVNDRPVSGWPDGANSLFQTACRYARENHRDFLWLESDCVPLRQGWLNAIGDAWEAHANADFLGHIYECQQPFLPAHLMSGIAVYSVAGIEKMHFLKDSPRAWDVDEADIMYNFGRHTPLIHHFWGQPNLPPTFVLRKDAHSPANAMTLDDIPPEACLFHRNKDGSLIRLLERKLFPQQHREKIAVCFNVYQGDIGLAILHAQWLKRMGRRHEHRAIICHDPSCPAPLLNQFEQLLRSSFSDVVALVYPRPPIPTYPAAANWAWQSTAIQMAKGKLPWFWFEADGFALKPDWIEQLQAEYDACGRSWMGPVVQHMFHMQGTSIYPADAAARMPSAMACGANHAFDMAAQPDTIHDRHDASHLMFHLWTLVGRMAHPVGGGELPVNITAAEVSQWLPKSAVFCHRVKDASLINLLLRGEFKP